MGEMQLNPYLNFPGNTREAMEFYQKVLGGKLDVQTFGEAPGMEVPPGYEDKVIHAMLDAGVYVAPSQFEALFVSAAHSDADIDATIAAAEAAFAAAR